MKNQVTLRGFDYIEGKDAYKEPYSIQKSSLASKNCIWVGCDNPIFDNSTGKTLNRRMHLTRKQAGKIADILQYFAENGELPRLYRGHVVPLYVGVGSEVKEGKVIYSTYAGAGVEEFEKEGEWGV